MGILRKFQQYRRLPQDPPPGPPHHLEEELDRLTGKIVRISPPAPELAVTRSPSVVRTASCSRSRVRTRRRPGPMRRSAWCAAPTEPACRPCPAATRSAGGDILIFRGWYSDIQEGYSDIDPALQPPGQQGGIVWYSGGIFWYRPCPAATRSAGGDSLIFRGDILI